MGSKNKDKSGKKRKRSNESVEEETQGLDHHETSQSAKATLKHEVVREGSPSGATVTSTESARKRAKRGPTQMHKIAHKKALGKKVKLKFNTRGLPKGKKRSPLMSYIGVVARAKVPIDIDRWPQVDGEVKERVWADVQDTFTLEPRHRGYVLKHACIKWRQFKTDLTNDYVIPFLGNKKALRKPPKDYNFVGLAHWKEFVKKRSTEEWEKLHREQSERAKQNKYHHRISRKGFVRLSEEMREEMDLDEDEDIDRATLWLKAREKPGGTKTEEVQAIEQRIVAFRKDKDEGKLDLSGWNDVLTQALGTPEHPGRLRAVGPDIMPSQYFGPSHLPRSRLSKAELLAREKQREKKWEEAHEKQRQANEALQQIIAHLEFFLTGFTDRGPLKSPVVSAPRLVEGDINSPLSDKGSNHIPQPAVAQPEVPDATLSAGLHNARSGDDVDHERGSKEEDDCEIIPSPTNEGAACDLAVESISNIVACGVVLEGDLLGEDDVDRAPLPSGCVRVAVEFSMNPSAALPFPVEGSLEVVGQAVGHHVAWPEELVIRKGKEIDVKKRKKLDYEETRFGKPIPPHPNVPKRCWLLYKHAMTTLKESRMPIKKQLDEEVFGGKKKLVLYHDDIIALLEFSMIGESIISTYMAFLHDQVKEKGELDLYAFVDAQQTWLTGKKERKTELVNYILGQLRNGKCDRTFFVPQTQECIGF